MDTLPSRELPKRCPTLSGQRGIAPAFGYDAPHPGARGTSTLLNNVLLSTHYGRSDSCAYSLFSALPRRRGRLFYAQVSLIHALGLPAIPPPTISECLASSGHVTHRRVEPRPHPTTGSSPNGNSGLRHWLAGSPHPTDRIEFVILRTGRSPPVASHHASRRDLALQRDRGYVRLQVTSTWRGLTAYTSLTNCALRRTSRGQRPRRTRPNMVRP